MTRHQFGGQWTEEKLNRIKKYLSAYMRIFKNNPRAAYFNTVYIDAFAGTGYRNPEKTDMEIVPLFDDCDARNLQKGSARIALDSDPSFDKYIFIEQSHEYAKELERLCSKYKAKIRIVREDANTYLQALCRETNWCSNRAVVFLDPYGMEVEWKTIEVIAQTQAIDLWILFPLGQAVNRLLTKRRIPEGAWAGRLNKFFGTDDWKDAFYKKEDQQTYLFGSGPAAVKTASFDSIGKYFINRLKTEFARVADNPLPLYNSKNVPI